MEFVEPDGHQEGVGPLLPDQTPVVGGVPSLYCVLDSSEFIKGKQERGGIPEEVSPGGADGGACSGDVHRAGEGWSVLCLRASGQCDKLEAALHEKVIRNS